MSKTEKFNRRFRTWIIVVIQRFWSVEFGTGDIGQVILDTVLDMLDIDMICFSFFQKGSF